MEKFKGKILSTDDKGNPTEIPLTPEQEVINQLIEQNEKLREAVKYLAEELDWVDKPTRMYKLDKINTILGE